MPRLPFFTGLAACLPMLGGAQVDSGKATDASPGLWALLASLALTEPVVAQATANADVELEEVVLVGTRAQPRSVFDSAVPIDVLSAEDLESTVSLGGEFGELLNALSPSFNFPRQSASGAADQARSGSLRGLNTDHVLILVNGKRQHTTPILFLEGAVGNGNAPFDFNTIPIGSIERVEILRDGASAQYGSDAVAGVINAVTKSGADGASVYLSYGAHITEIEPQEGFDLSVAAIIAWVPYPSALNKIIRLRRTCFCGD